MPLPPGPTRSPLANLRRFSREPYAVFWDAAAEYGPVFSFRVAGQPPWVSIGEPELIEQIFRGTSAEFHNATEIMRYMLPPGTLVLLDDEPDDRARKLLLPAFHGERMSGYARLVRAAVDAALAQVRPGQRVVLTELLGRITTRAVVECIFGIRDAPRRDRLLELIEADTAYRRFVPWPLAPKLFGGKIGLGRLGPLGFARTQQALRALIFDEIAGCRRAPRGRDDVLARLLAARDDGDQALDDELHAQLMSVLLGGLDTSAFSLAWALYFLLTHRGAREHVLEEIQRGGAGPWTSAVIDETLRIRPIAHHTARQLSRELQLGPWLLPAGTFTLPSQAIAHFRGDLWINPHEFRPERFLPPSRGSAPELVSRGSAPETSRPSPFVYFPFGGGTRTCLGSPFALMQMREILARLLERTDLRLADADPRPALRGRLVGPSDGVPVFVERIRPVSVD